MKKTALPWFALFIIMIASAVSLPGVCLAEELSGLTTTSPAVVSSPSATPAIISPQETFAPATTVNELSASATHAVSVGAIALRDDYNNRGAIVFTEFEKKLSRRFALFARLGRIEYTPNGDIGHYGEGGRGNGIELGGRVSLALREQVSFYLGAGIGGWRLDWYWKDEEKTPFETAGRRSSRVSSFQVHAGWKIRLGSGTTYVNPSIQAGSFFPRRDDDPMEFGDVYSSIGLALGRAW
jgi:hypothetical protein